MRYFIGAAFFFGVIAYAIWKGGRAERWVAGATLVAVLATPLVFRHARLADPQWSVALVDLVLLLIIGGIAVIYRRSWLVLAAAIHGLGTASHIALVFDPDIKGLAYLSSIVFWSYVTNACLLMSTIQAHRERRRYGSSQPIQF